MLAACATDSDLGEQRLRTTPLPELPDGFDDIADEMGLLCTLLRSESTDLRAQATGLSLRAQVIAADQARLFAPDACRPQAWPHHRTYWERVEHRSGLLWNFAVGDDLHTVRDSHQPLWERAIALASILPIGKPLKGVRVADDLIEAEKGAVTAARVARRAETADDGWRAAAGSRAQTTRRLERNMREAGMGAKPAGYETHHIVAAFAPGARRAQEALMRVGIRPNDAVNGVYLPGPTLKEAEPLPPALFHRPIHTTEYYKQLERRLRNVRTRQQAVEVLAKLRRELEGSATSGERR